VRIVPEHSPERLERVKKVSSSIEIILIRRRPPFVSAFASPRLVPVLVVFLVFLAPSSRASLRESESTRAIVPRASLFVSHRLVRARRALERVAAVRILVGMPPHGLSTIRATNLVERGVARDAQDVVRARAVVVRARGLARHRRRGLDATVCDDSRRARRECNGME
jgi:hypothetical protein